MRNRWILSLISVCTCFVGADSASTDDKKSLSQTYYDIRERVATKMTFEWASVAILNVREDLINILNTFREEQAKRFGGVGVEIIDPSITTRTTELHGYITIERTPNILRLRQISESLSLNTMNKSLNHTDIYLQGSTMFQVHYHSLDKQHKIEYVSIFQSEDKDILGMDSPNLSTDSCLRIFLGGISPLRYKGALPNQWRVVSASPEQWIFELITQSEKEPKVTLYLSRLHQDCPAKLEIEHPDGSTYVWRTLKYRLVEGAWFPSEVEYVTRTRYWNIYKKYTLVKVEQTREIVVDIPEGTPVLDWRKSGLRAWQASGLKINPDGSWKFPDEDSAYERTTWNSTIFQLKP